MPHRNAPRRRIELHLQAPAEPGGRCTKTWPRRRGTAYRSEHLTFVSARPHRSGSAQNLRSGLDRASEFSSNRQCLRRVAPRSRHPTRVLGAPDGRSPRSTSSRSVSWPCPTSARALQRSPCPNRGVCISRVFRRPRAVDRLEACLRPCELGGGGGDRAPAAARALASDRPLPWRPARSRESSVVRHETIVALGGGFAGALQRLFGGGDFIAGVVFHRRRGRRWRLAPAPFLFRGRRAPNSNDETMKSARKERRWPDDVGRVYRSRCRTSGMRSERVTERSAAARGATARCKQPVTMRREVERRFRRV